MTVKICPQCNSAIQYMPNSGDFVHDCRNTSSSVLANEDVVRLGDHVDYAGSGVIPKAQVVNQGAGVTNQFRGKRAFIQEKEMFGGVTQRGANKQTHRQRYRLTYIEDPDKL